MTNNILIMMNKHHNVYLKVKDQGLTCVTKSCMMKKALKNIKQTLD